MIYKTPIYALFKSGHYGAFLGKPIAGLDDFKEEFPALLNLPSNRKNRWSLDPGKLEVVCLQV